jgi:hypothetical protein
MNWLQHFNPINRLRYKRDVARDFIGTYQQWLYLRDFEARGKEFDSHMVQAAEIVGIERRNPLPQRPRCPECGEIADFRHKYSPPPREGDVLLIYCYCKNGHDFVIRQKISE